MPTYQALTYEVRSTVARITFNRPGKLNAFNNTLFRELMDAVQEAEKDRQVRVIHLRGAGTSFSVGEDLSAEDTDQVIPPNPSTKPYLRDAFSRQQRLRQGWQHLYECYKPLIAEVHGYCLGCAAEMALLCHTSIAAEDAVFGTPALRAGVTPPSPLWVYKLGVRKAQDLLFTGRYITGTEAQRLGLVTLVAPRAQLEERAQEAVEFVANEQGLGGRDGNVLGIGGIHPNFNAPVFRRITLDANGLATSWGFCSAISALSTIQRYGVRQDELRFWDARDAEGVRTAVRRRDEPLQRFFPFPHPRP
ncbi:MAG: enoyl-CoA hydratase/isomerase family protein [Chloroflexi bacterium]|nr:enoyl-CoA hydratase/isomerase family protein [Chloroflexota bacterium]